MACNFTQIIADARASGLWDQVQSLSEGELVGALYQQATLLALQSNPNVVTDPRQLAYDNSCINCMSVNEKLVVIAGLLCTYASGACVSPDIAGGSSGTLNATQNSAFSYVPTLSSGAGVVWSLQGTLPAGLSFNSGNGSITGTPTGTGTSVVTLTAQNACGTDQRILTIVVAAAPVQNQFFAYWGRSSNGGILSAAQIIALGNNDGTLTTIDRAGNYPFNTGTSDQFLYFWTDNALGDPGAVGSGNGFINVANGFPYSMADSAATPPFGTPQVNGWFYEAVTVNARPGKLWRSFNSTAGGPTIRIKP